MLDRTLALGHSLWLSLKNCERGVTMPEYGLILAGVSLVALIGASLLGADISAMFEGIGNTVNP